MGQNGQRKCSVWIHTGAHFPECSENGLFVVIGSVLLYRKGKQSGNKVRSIKGEIN